MNVILTLLCLAINRFHEVAASTIEDDVLPSFPYAPYVGSSSIRTRSGSYSDRPLFPPNTIDNVVSCGSCCFPDPTPIMESSFVTDVSNPYRDELLTDNFFQKVIDVIGIPVAGSAAVSDQALLEAALTLAKMSSKVPSLLALLRTEEVYFAVIGRKEILTDIPGYARLGPDWDWPRGVGATQGIPISSCAEENLLCLEDDVYRDENICVHETAHTLQGSGGKLPNARIINGLGDLDAKLREIYNKDVAGGSQLWKNTYAAVVHEEIWAEGTQSYFDVNREGPVGGDGIHNEVYYGELLQSYHPELYEVIDMVFDSELEFKCPPTDFDDCDCSVIRDQCERAGIALVPTTSPTSHPTPPPTPEPTPDVSRSSVDKTLCSENAQCAALDGFCCPNNVGDILACCDPPTDSPSTAPSPFTQAPSNSPSLSTPVPSVAPTVAPASTEPSAAISTEPSAAPTETGPSAPSGSPGNSNGISQEDNEAGNGFWSNFFTTGSIVGVSVGFALLVLLMFTILYMQRRSQNPSQGRSTKPVNTLQLEEEKDSISAISQSKSNEAPTGNQRYVVDSRAF